MNATYDKLLNEHSFSDTGTAEKTDFTTTSVRSEQIHDLDTSNQDLGGCGLVNKLGSVGMDGKSLDSLDRSTLIDGVSGNVHDTTKCARANGNHNGGTSVGGLGATYKALGPCNEPWLALSAVAVLC